MTSGFRDALKMTQLTVFQKKTVDCPADSCPKKRKPDYDGIKWESNSAGHFSSKLLEQMTMGSMLLSVLDLSWQVLALADHKISKMEPILEIPDQIMLVLCMLSAMFWWNS